VVHAPLQIAPGMTVEMRNIVSKDDKSQTIEDGATVYNLPEHEILKLKQSEQKCVIL
jgi:hypothetical protein